MELVPLTEAASLLGGLGRTKLYELVGSGALETVKIGRRRLVVRASLDTYVSQLLDSSRASTTTRQTAPATPVAS